MIHLRLMAEIGRTLAQAEETSPPFNSPYEGYAVLREELEDLWEEVRAVGWTNEDRAEMRQVAVHVAALALRFIIDLCEDEEATP
jgi:hypothetical protein